MAKHLKVLRRPLDAAAAEQSARIRIKELSKRLSSHDSSWVTPRLQRKLSAERPLEARRGLQFEDVFTIRFLIRLGSDDLKGTHADLAIDKRQKIVAMVLDRLRRKPPPPGGSDLHGLALLQRLPHIYCQHPISALELFGQPFSQCSRPYSITNSFINR